MFFVVHSFCFVQTRAPKFRSLTQLSVIDQSENLDCANEALIGQTKFVHIYLNNIGRMV